MIDFSRMDWLDEQQSAREDVDYSTTVDPNKILRDRRFLNDLRAYYADKGETYNDDEEMVRAWLRGSRWERANTVAAVNEWIESDNMVGEQRSRYRRLLNVFDRLPDFTDETGEKDYLGTIGTYLAAGAIDPINLIPAAGAGKVAGGAMAVGAKEGAEHLVRKGAWEAAKRGAKVEGAINAGAEGIINIAEQNRDIDLGRQDEFSMAELAMRTGVGAGAGAVLGGMVGGAAGAFRGPQEALRIQKDELSRMGTQGLGQDVPTEGPSAFMRGMPGSEARAQDISRVEGQGAFLREADTRRAAMDADTERLAAEAAAERKPMDRMTEIEQAIAHQEATVVDRRQGKSSRDVIADAQAELDRLKNFKTAYERSALYDTQIEGYRLNGDDASLAAAERIFIKQQRTENAIVRAMEGDTSFDLWKELQKIEAEDRAQIAAETTKTTGKQATGGTGAAEQPVARQPAQTQAETPTQPVPEEPATGTVSATQEGKAAQTATEQPGAPTVETAQPAPASVDDVVAATISAQTRSHPKNKTENSLRHRAEAHPEFIDWLAARIAAGDKFDFRKAKDVSDAEKVWNAERRKAIKTDEQIDADARAEAEAENPAPQKPMAGEAGTVPDHVSFWKPQGSTEPTKTETTFKQAWDEGLITEADIPNLRKPDNGGKPRHIDGKMLEAFLKKKNAETAAAETARAETVTKTAEVKAGRAKAKRNTEAENIAADEEVAKVSEEIEKLQELPQESKDAILKQAAEDIARLMYPELFAKMSSTNQLEILQAVVNALKAMSDPEFAVRLAAVKELRKTAGNIAATFKLDLTPEEERMLPKLTYFFKHDGANAEQAELMALLQIRLRRIKPVETPDESVTIPPRDKGMPTEKEVGRYGRIPGTDIFDSLAAARAHCETRPKVVVAVEEKYVPITDRNVKTGETSTRTAHMKVPVYGRNSDPVRFKASVDLEIKTGKGKSTVLAAGEIGWYDPVTHKAYRHFEDMQGARREGSFKASPIRIYTEDEVANATFRDADLTAAKTAVADAQKRVDQIQTVIDSYYEKIESGTAKKNVAAKAALDKKVAAIVTRENSMREQRGKLIKQKDELNKAGKTAEAKAVQAKIDPYDEKLTKLRADREAILASPEYKATQGGVNESMIRKSIEVKEEELYDAQQELDTLQDHLNHLTLVADLKKKPAATKPAAARKAAAAPEPEQKPEVKSALHILKTEGFEAMRVKIAAALEAYKARQAENASAVKTVAEPKTLSPADREAAIGALEAIEVPEGMRPALRSIEKGYISVLSDKQVAEGKTVRAILGEKGNPNDYEYGFLPDEAVRAISKERWFKPAGVETKVPFESPTMPLAEARSTMLSSEHKERLRDAGWTRMSAGTNVSIADLSLQLELLYHRRFALTEKKDVWDALIRMAIEGERVISELSPGGIVKPVTDRSTAAAALLKLFAREDSEVLSEALRVLQRLGGDSEVGPVFDKSPVGANAYGHTVGQDALYWSAERDTSNKILLDSPEWGSKRDVETFGKSLPLRALVHEVAHWSFFNILSPEDRLEFMDIVGRNLFDNGKRTTADTDWVSRAMDKGESVYGDKSPGELFAEQFSKWYAGRSKVMKDASFWGRMTKYVKAIFEWFTGKPIDPDLEPLFSKILPDEVERQYFAAGGTLRLKDLSNIGKFSVAHAQRLEDVSRRLDEALLSADDADLYEPGRELLSILYTLAPRIYKKEFGRFGPFKASVLKTKIARYRDGLIQAFRDSGAEPRLIDNSKEFREFTQMAEQVRLDLADIFSMARAGSKTPEDIAAITDLFSAIKEAYGLPDDMMKRISSAIVADSKGKLPNDELRALIDDVADHVHSAVGDIEVDPEDAIRELTVEKSDLGGGVAHNVNPEAAGRHIRQFLGDDKLTEINDFIQSALRQSLLDTDGPGALRIPRAPKSLVHASPMPTKELRELHGRFNNRALTKQIIREQLKEAREQAAAVAAATKGVRESRTGSTMSGSELHNTDITELTQLFHRHKDDANKQAVLEAIALKINATPFMPDNAPSLDGATWNRLRNMTTKEFDETLKQAIRDGDNDLVNGIIWEFGMRSENRIRMRAAGKAGVKQLPQVKRPPARKVETKPVQQAVAKEVKDIEAPSDDSGIPGNAPTGYVDVLRRFRDSRDHQTEISLRTLVYRLLVMDESEAAERVPTNEQFYRLIGMKPPGDVRPITSGDPGFKNFRRKLSDISTALTRNTDKMSGDDAIKELMRILLKTRQYTSGEGSITDGYADALVDRTFKHLIGEQPSSKEARQAIREDIDQLSEQLAYVLNGTVSRPEVKKRFPTLFLLGDVRQTETRPTFGFMAEDGRVLRGAESRFEGEIDDVLTSDEQISRAVMAYNENGYGLGPGGIPRVFYADASGKRLSTNIAVITELPDATRFDQTPKGQENSFLAGGINFISSQISGIKDQKLAKQMNDQLAQAVANLKKNGVNVDIGATPVFVKLHNVMKRSTMIPEQAADAFAQEIGTLTGKSVSFTSGRSLTFGELMDDLVAQVGLEPFKKAIRENSGVEAIVSENAVTGIIDVDLIARPQDVTRSVQSFLVPLARMSSDIPKAGGPIQDAGRIFGSVLNGIAHSTGIDPMDYARNVLHTVGARTNQEDRRVASILVKPAKTVEDLDRIAEASRTTMIFGSNSKRMRQYGMHWFGKFTEDYYPRVHRTFAEYWQPVQEALDVLTPRSSRISRFVENRKDGVGRALHGMHIGSRSVVQSLQPKSHVRVMDALRYGHLNSSYYDRLSEPEKQVYRMIDHARMTANEQLKDSGVLMGTIKGYVGQVWSRDAIESNPELFKGMMSSYLLDEWARNGIAKPNAKAEAEARAAQIMSRLIDDDGVYLPSVGTGKSGREDMIDYQRIVRLQDNPDMMRAFVKEGFLDNDLERVWVKYFDQVARRLAQVQTLGYGSHAFDDYLTVVQNGKDGIVQLLTSNKAFVNRFRNFGGQADRSPENFSVPVLMPFTNQSEKASQFADELIQLVSTQGVDAAKKRLGEIMPPQSVDKFGRVAYERRADAIANAISDMRLALDGSKTKVGPQAFKDAEGTLLALQGRYTGATWNESLRGFSRGMRAFNNVSLLGFSTLTSLSDTILPLIRSGDFKAWTTALARFASDPDYRQQIRRTGVAMENIMHGRMMGLYQGDVAGSAGKLQTAFFEVNLLTPWTQMQRELAGAVGLEALRAQASKASRYWKQGVSFDKQSPQWKRARRILSAYGLGDFATDFSRELDVQDPVVREAMIKFANDTIFSPNPTDIPLWAQTPVGAMIFQLKSFPTMLGRMAFGSEGRGGVVLNAYRALKNSLGYEGYEGYTGQDIIPAALLFSVGPLAGAGVLASKDVIQQRGEEGETLRHRNITKSWVGRFAGMESDKDADDFWGWYLEGMTTMGGLGLLAEIFQDTAANADNGYFGVSRMLSAIGGPSFSTAMDTHTIFGAASSQVQKYLGTKEQGNSEERAMIRAGVSRIPILGGFRPFREAMIPDLIEKQ